jgi:putative aldouronate transport system permease protein
MVEERSFSYYAFHILNYSFLSLFALFCLLPFWIMAVASVTDDMALRKAGYLPWTNQWSIEAYRYVLSGPEVIRGYQVSLFITTVGTISAVTVMSGLGYLMSLKRVKFANKLAFFVYFTMVFSGGLIPFLIVCRNYLGLKDNIWALILPMMVSPFWVLVLRNFFSSLPLEILESAYIDGASDATILYAIVLPLSKPVLATVALFMAVAYWNDWFLGAMLLDFAKFKPLALLIMKMVNNIQNIQQAVKQPGVIINLSQIPTLSIQMATALITIGPIILVYPFVQKYFVKGLTLGAVK